MFIYLVEKKKEKNLSVNLRKSKMMSIKEESSFNNDDLLMIEDMLEDDVKQEPIQTTTVRNPKRLREIDLNAIESTAKLPDVVKIEKRNARERNRVRVVNDEFERLRRVVLGADYCRRRVTDSRDESNPGRKLSKLKILRLSIEYIQFLSSLLNNEVYTVIKTHFTTVYIDKF